MRFKGTWGMIAVLAALGAYFWFVEQPAHEAKQAAEKKAGLVLPDFATAKVSGVEITRGDVHARLVKGDDGKWVLAEPWNDRADDGRVRTLLSDLAALKAEREVAPADADPAPFGLDKPDTIVTTRGVEATLAVGALNPSGDSRFVRLGDGPIQVVKGTGLAGLLKDPSELRNKDVVEGFPWDRLSALDIRAPGGETVVLEKQGDDGWRVAGPGGGDADPEAAKKITDKLRWAKITSFLSGDDDANAAEKLADGWTVTLKAEGEAGPTVVRLAEVDGKVWADRSGRDARFVVGKDVLDAFRVKADDLIRKKPVYVKAWKVSKLTVTVDAVTKIFEKKDGKWVEGDRAVTGDEGARIQAALTSLETGEATEVIGDPEGAETYGFDTPAASFEVTDTDGKTRAVVLGRGKDAVYARSGNEGPVYTMDVGYLDKIAALVEPPKSEASEQKAGTPDK